MLIPYKVVFIAAAIGVLPVFGWLWFLVRNHNFSFESSNFVLKIIFWGVLTAVPASIFEIVVIETEGEGQLLQAMQTIWQGQRMTLAVAALASAGLVAAIEEVSKGIGIGMTTFLKKIRSSNDGLVIGMLIGLAFGVTENGVYFASAMGVEQGADFFIIVLLRFILSTSAHVIYSSTMGSLLADAFLTQNFLLKSFKIVLAFLVPISIHTFFNLLLSTAYSWFAVFVILIGFIILWMRYQRVARGGKTIE